MYTIIDIETTGGSHKTGKITEVAIYKFDGEKIIDEFVSLINPEIYIPPYIVKLTGITNEMVEDAPRFFEVAKQIVEITEDTIFVAHNAPFDYGFIRAEFASLGFTFNRSTLCTVKLSRKFIPGHPSYSLGNICSAFGISNSARHRAAGDALATVELFKILLKRNSGIIIPDDPYSRFSTESLHPSLSIEYIKQLPDDTGVYYFHDEEGNVIYVGKSKSIKKKVLTHLGNPKTKKGVELRQKTASITYTVTGSELVALLKELDEIKVLKPHYNRVQKKPRNSFGLYSYLDRKGYCRLLLKKNSGVETPHFSFGSMKEASKTLFDWVEEYSLCQQLCGLYNNGVGGCFQYGLKLCKGACVGEELPEEYNARVEELLKELSCKFNNVVIIERGRSADENSLIVIENGLYLGFGWIDSQEQVNTPQEFKEHISIMEDSSDVRKIISGYLKRNTPERVIEY